MFRKRLTILGLMLAVLLLLLGWFSSLSANSSPAAKVQPSPNAAVVQIVPDELEPSVRVGNMRVSTATGQPLFIYAVNYLVDADAPEAMARQYLRENAALLHLQSPDLSDLAHTVTRLGPSGPTVRFQQVVNGIPVYKSDVVVHLNNAHTVTFVASEYKSTLAAPTRAATLTAVDATQATRQYLGITGKTQVEKSDLMLYYLQGQTYLVYRVNIVASEPMGDWVAIVDAHTGEFHKLVNQSMDFGPGEAEGSGTAVAPTLLVTGTGNVFDPDPLSSAGATYGDTGFTDNNDADSPQLNAELVSVPLKDITFSGGLYRLDGPYAAIRDTEAPNFGLFSQATSDWNFNRFDNAFEAAHTYYHIDTSMRYLNETLGLSIMPYQYSGGARFDPHGLNGDDNSHYSSGSGEVAFGEGGVDDAEDADVVYHELGHGIHDWVTNGGLSQVNGLSEGSGDYWAQSYSRSLGQWQPGDPAYNWVFDWDGHNPFWPGRVTNYPAVYPGGLVGQIHTDGQIWSTCNMRVWDAIGREQMDRAFWEGLGMTNSSTDQEDAANAVYQAAIDMGYSASELTDMHDIYATCVYVVPDVPLADFDVTVTPDPLSVCSPDNAVYTVDITEFNGFGTAVTLSSVGQPNPPNTAVFSNNNQVPPYTSTLTIGTNGAATGQYAIDVVGTSPTTTHTATVQLLVADSAPGVPTLVDPANGATAVPFTPTFVWTAVAGATSYYLEVADDAGFSNIVYSATDTATSHLIATPLDPLTTYYWRVTGENGCGMGSPSTAFSFTTQAVPDTLCSAPALAIPDNGTASDSMTVVNAGSLQDMDISINASHTWVGDLSFVLSHDGVDVTIIDRPGYTGTGFGCSGNDIDITAVDDEGTDGPVENQCADAPALFGNPTPNNPLSAFDGQDLSGEWTLSVTDSAGGDTGTLNNWCLIPTVDQTAPMIAVEPASLVTTQPVDVQVTHPLTISNLGDADLTWSIVEDDGATNRNPSGGWADNFDSYATGSQMHGQGGWKGWDNSPAAGALTSSAQARSVPNSVDTLAGTDLVHEYTGYTSGQWVYTAWQYIPGSYTGQAYFILLNTYADGGTNNWSTQVCFDAATDLLYDAIGGTCTGASTLSIVYDQWVEIRVEIDLDTDSQTFYYNNQMLFQDTWTGHVSGAGALNIGAVDLFANGASSVFYDDMSLAEPGSPTPAICEVPSDIPWLSVSPDSGTTAASETSTVDVTFDSTGLTGGSTYTATLCVESNDAITPLVTVPVTLTVESASYGVSVGTADAAESGAPGATITYTVWVTNEGNVADTFDLAVSGNSWMTMLSDSTLTLDAGASAEVMVMVHIDLTAVNNATDTATLTATSQADSTATDVVDLTTTAVVPPEDEFFIFLPVVMKP